MRKLTVTYIGAPTEAAPYGELLVEEYSGLIGYTFDPEDKTLAIEHRDGNAGPRLTTTYPESRVIRTKYMDTNR